MLVQRFGLLRMAMPKKLTINKKIILLVNALARLHNFCIGELPEDEAITVPEELNADTLNIMNHKGGNCQVGAGYGRYHLAKWFGARQCGTLSNTAPAPPLVFLYHISTYDELEEMRQPATTHKNCQKHRDHGGRLGFILCGSPFDIFT